MWVRTNCRLELDYRVPTPLILMLRPRSGAGQWVSDESYRFSENVEVMEYTDPYGNLCQRLTAPADGFVVETSATVNAPESMDGGSDEPFIDVNSLPEEVLQYLQPSRYCESDRLGQETLNIVAGEKPGYAQVSAIIGHIRQNVAYHPGSSAQPRSAAEILHQGNGVCKDLAHAAIAMCRSISIPARFVVGYLHGLEPMDLHAWLEAWVGDRWFAFDPTQSDLHGARVAIAYGRDAADVSIYHQFGPPARATSMAVDISPV